MLNWNTTLKYLRAEVLNHFTDTLETNVASDIRMQNVYFIIWTTKNTIKSNSKSVIHFVVKAIPILHVIYYIS